MDYSTPLLNNLLTRDDSPMNTDPVGVILSIIGCRRTRQLQNLMVAASGNWKYGLILSMPSVE